MSIVTKFRDICIGNGICESCFTGISCEDIDDFQMCHLLPKSEKIINKVKELYNCSNEIADILLDIPLFNVIPFDKKKDNVKEIVKNKLFYVDCELVNIVHKFLNENEVIRGYWGNLNSIHMFHVFRLTIKGLRSHNIVHMDWNNIKDIESNTSSINQIHLFFHKEIGVGG